MTNFAKDSFSYHGGFLMYTGDYAGRPTYEAGPNVHPTRVGTGKDLFIARFKYSRSPFTKAQFVKELMKNHTVESYAAALAAGESPLNVLRAKNPSWYENIVAAWTAKNLETV